jgi:hypothetical protein
MNNSIHRAHLTPARLGDMPIQNYPDCEYNTP